MRDKTGHAGVRWGGLQREPRRPLGMSEKTPGEGESELDQKNTGRLKDGGWREREREGSSLGDVS